MADPNQQYVPWFLLEEDEVPVLESEIEPDFIRLLQFDRGDTISNISDQLNSTNMTVDNSQYSSQDEFDSAPIPAVLVPAPGHPSLGQQVPGLPALLVDAKGLAVQHVSLALFLIFNVQSLFKCKLKSNSKKISLSQLETR